MPDWDALQAALAGDLLRPGTPGYEAARAPAISNFADARPGAVVRCRAEADVAAALAFAADAGLPLAPRSGGHDFAGRSTTTGFVLDLAPLDRVEYADGVATIGAGARLGAVYDALEPDGVTLPAGCGPEVGIAGLTLGGGFGVLGRRHGLLADALVGARATLADGRVVDCDATTEPDLFWALRGAGGARVAVVTSLTFRTVPAPETTSFHLVWPFAQAAEILLAWQTWSPDGPDELAASLLVVAPPDPADPPRVHLFGTMLAPAAATRAVLGAIAGDAEWRFCDTLPFRATKRRLAAHGPGDDRPGTHLHSRSEYLRAPLSAAAVTALADHLAQDRVPGESRELDLSPWGGAYSRVPADATAFAHRDARALLKHTAVTPPGGRSGWQDRSWAIARAAGTGGVYPNFPEPGLDPWSAEHLGGNLARLRAVKRRLDPSGLLG